VKNGPDGLIISCHPVHSRHSFIYLSVLFSDTSYDEMNVDQESEDRQQILPQLIRGVSNINTLKAVRISGDAFSRSLIMESGK
jgi:hypothetical protein